MAEGEVAIQPVAQQQGTVENAGVATAAAGAVDPLQLQQIQLMMMQMQTMAAAGGLPPEMMQMMQQWTGAAQQATTAGAAQQATTTPDFGKGCGKGAKGPGTPSDNLYIRGLPSPQADSDMLFRLFTDLGLNVVRHKLIVDTKGAGSSAAMVQLASVEQAQTAVNALNGREAFGGTLTMSYVESSGKGGPKGGCGDPALGGNSKYLVVVAKEHGNGDNLFVSGLPPPTVDRIELHKLFESRGFTVVRSKMLPDTRGKGHSSALVQVGSQAEALAAVEQLNGQLVESLGLVAVELTGDLDPTTPIHGNVFVGSIPKEFEEKELMEVFKQCGTITSCKISRGWGGESKGSGFVKFETKEEAKIAIDCLNGFNNLVVKPADSDVKQAGDKGAGKGWFKGKDGWGKDAWGKDAWGKDGWGKDSWGKNAWGQEPMVIPARTIPPPTRSMAESQTLEWETEMTASFAGESSEGSPSDTVFLLGLPSPEVDQQRLSEIFAGLGMATVKIDTIPDDTDGQCSAAMVQFASIQAATDALAAVQGKKPSQLGITAKGATLPTNGMKGKPAYGKGATPQVIPGPYSDGGKGAAKNGWNCGGWDGSW